VSGRRRYDEKGQMAIALGADPVSLPVFRMRRGKLVQIPPEWVGREWFHGVKPFWRMFRGKVPLRHPRKLVRAMKWGKGGPGHPNTHDGRVRVMSSGRRYDWRKDYADEL